MPETGIGLFPGVGGTWILSQAQGEIGTYIGLTGASCGPAEAIYAGFADHYMATDRLDELVTTLAALPAGADGTEVELAIRALCEVPPSCTFEQENASIDLAFGANTVEGIIANLQVQGTEFCHSALKALLQKFPTSLKLALALLQDARSSSGLEECLDREYAAITSILNEADFYECVRAAVIDKDRNPRWAPSTLAEVQPPDLDALVAAQGPLFHR